MRAAAREDRELNEEQLPATKKMSMLATVMAHLGKVDFCSLFVYCLFLLMFIYCLIVYFY